MNVLRESTSRTWGAFVLVYVIGMIGLACYWLFADRGPVRWLGEWQAQHLFHGSWYPKLTTILVMLAMVVPLVVIKLAIEKSTGRRLTAPLT